MAMEIQLFGLPENIVIYESLKDFPLHVHLSSNKESIAVQKCHERPDIWGICSINEVVMEQT